MGSNRKKEGFKSLYKRLSALLIFAALLGIFNEMWFTRFNTLRGEQFLGKGNLLVIAVYSAILFLVLYVMGGLKIGVNKTLNLVLSQIVSVIIVDIMMWAQVILIIGDIWHMKQIAEAIGLLMLYDILVCTVMTALLMAVYYRLFPPYHMLLINGEHNNRLAGKIETRSDKYRIVGEISVFEDEEKVFEEILKYDAVLLNDLPTKSRNRILKYCFEKRVRVYFTPKLSDILVKGADKVDLFDSPLYLCKNFGMSFEERLIKRAADVFFSVLFIILTGPIMLLIALAIKVYDRGPVFFKQDRVTRDDRVFKMIKFRSMIENAEEDGKSHPAVDDDERITPVGRFIRSTRLDELPQLFNILKGDMSFVGPRPERIEHVEKYTAEIPEFSYRTKVKGGLTGLAQVYGKYNTTAYDKLKMDLTYIVNYSFVLDIRIVMTTLKVIFKKESTEGFLTDVSEDDE
ncbi:MAG TPA: exopolysaccharide biosynthesis polyprenyl glycosylphosphotransferase [Lachnospiraceae bacterium]|nr:exopolysaccharide biosynthesis polyprenyl glycosylphosphotransferase [Lachnospiraceae bacterium]